MRIGILTYHFAYNYGAVLQAYALCHYLRESGHDAEIINYYPQELRSLYSLNPFIISRKKDLITKSLKFFKCRKQYFLFNDFITSDLVCTDPIENDELSSLNSKFDMFITGSDQVWNDKIVNKIEPYFLNFVSSDHYKVAYAASLGTNNISDRCKKNITRYLKEFDSISVREESAVSILKDLGIYSQAISDPVFLLDIGEWNKLGKEIEVPDKFLLYYSLDYDPELDNRAEELAIMNNLEIIVIHSTCEKKVNLKNVTFRFDVGPREFLYLVKHAQVIVTNSFHATAFGAIYHKQIVNISSSERQGRAANLVKRLNANKCIKNNCIEISETDISDHELDAMREEAREFLVQIIDK